MRRRRTKVRPPLRTRATAKPLVRKTQQFDLGAFCLKVKWRPAQARDDLDLETVARAEGNGKPHVRAPAAYFTK